MKEPSVAIGCRVRIRMGKIRTQRGKETRSDVSLKRERDE
jgi:hypothetical protein